MKNRTNTSTERPSSPFPLRVRIIQIFFLVLAVIATLCLAYWQWSTWQSSGGTFQNLGYAIQWPMFGVFFVVAYRKYIQYETERLRGDETPAVPQHVRESMQEIPDDFLQDLHSPENRDVDVSQRGITDDRRQRARRRASNIGAEGPARRRAEPHTNTQKPDTENEGKNQ